jgi:Muramidase (flagellum-specific)
MEKEYKILAKEKAQIKEELMQEKNKPTERTQEVDIFQAEVSIVNTQLIRNQSATDEQIKNWATKYTTMAKNIDNIIDLSHAYGIDPTYIAALVALETGYMEKGAALSHNNVSGIKNGADYQYYETFYDSIKDTVRLTALYTTYDPPLDTVEKISSVWSESSTKAQKTLEIMLEIQKTE